MKRYCPNCNTTYGFEIKRADDLNHLVCPECKQPIDKNSRPPIEGKSTDEVTTEIGNFIGFCLRFSYLFYFVLSAVGIVAFIFKWFPVLYVVTGTQLLVYIFLMIIGVRNFKWGLLLIPVGAIIGFIIFRSIAGICLGICIVYFVRHLIRDMFLRLIFKMVDFANK